MSDRKAVIGIDLGTQSTKAALVALDGHPIGSHSVAVEFERPQPGWGEQSPDILVQSTLACLSALSGKFPDIDVVGLGIAAQMGGAIGIDRGFDAVTPHELWLDTRADEDRQELLGLYGPEILAKNGIIPFVAPRVRRWLRLDPAFAQCLASVVAPAGYLAGRLTGAEAKDAVCDRTQANLYGCFDVARNQWDDDLAQRCGLPPELLPRIADPFDIAGRLSAEMAARCGLAAGIPVAAGMGDGTGGWFAAGGIESGVSIDTSGSSAHFAVTVDRFITDPSGLLACMPSAAPGRFYLLGFTTSTGLAHRWLSRTFGKSYQELETLSVSVPPGSNGILAVPHLNGRVSPFEASMKGGFLGFDDKSGPGEFYRALLEASAYELNGWLAAALKLAPGLTLSNVVNVGGGAQSALWNQIKADVTGLSLHIASPEINAARGAALAAGIAAGAIDRASRDWFAADYLEAQTFTPDAARHRLYAPYRDSYAHLTDQLLPIYRTLQQLRQNQRQEKDTP
jgi:xylulokinase